MFQAFPPLPWWERGTAGGMGSPGLHTAHLRSEAPFLAPTLTLTQRILTPCSQCWEA